LSRARVVVEVAFGRLKAQWCQLSKQMDLHIDNMSHVVITCCVLHKYVHGDSFGYKTTILLIVLSQTSLVMAIIAAVVTAVVREWLLRMHW